MDLERKNESSELQCGSLMGVQQAKEHTVRQLSVVQLDGKREVFDVQRIYRTIAWASKGYESIINADAIMQETVRNIYDGITASEISEALVMATTPFIEKDPAYGYVASQLLLKKLFAEVTGLSIERCDVQAEYRKAFVQGIKTGVAKGLFDERMLQFDLEALAQELMLERDQLFFYMGMRTLYERYFIKHEEQRLELPQAFWMRVAMGVALEEKDSHAAATSFYRLTSQLRYVPSTPTLLHAGLSTPQLSSCYLTTVSDDLHHIYKCIGDNAQMSKWSMISPFGPTVSITAFRSGFMK